MTFKFPNKISYFTIDINIALLTGITIPRPISYMYFNKAFIYILLMMLKKFFGQNKNKVKSLIMKNELGVFFIRKPDYASFGLCYNSSALIGYVKFTSFRT